MFENLTAWQWVALAWLQLAVVYGGYLLYLTARRRRLERERLDARNAERANAGFADTGSETPRETR